MSSTSTTRLYQVFQSSETYMIASMLISLIVAFLVFSPRQAPKPDQKRKRISDIDIAACAMIILAGITTMVAFMLRKTDFNNRNGLWYSTFFGFNLVSFANIFVMLLVPPPDVSANSTDSTACMIKASPKDIAVGTLNLVAMAIVVIIFFSIPIGQKTNALSDFMGSIGLVATVPQQTMPYMMQYPQGMPMSYTMAPQGMQGMQYTSPMQMSPPQNQSK